MSTGCHAELKIIKGVAVTPGDTNSAEAGLEVIDLLDPSGFSLKSDDGWSMSRPALKNGGLWADTQLAPGRSLIAGADGNVTETMQVTLMAGSMQVLAALQGKLERFILDVRAFQDEMVQIEPVYLKHQVIGEPGPRYALIHNIEVAAEDPTALMTPVRDLTLTIEREPYWRWEVPPGANPKWWSLHKNGLDPDINNVSLIDADNHLASAEIANRTEWDAGFTNFVSRNFIDIPAASIPGDAPALVEISIVGIPASVYANLSRIYISSRHGRNSVDSVGLAKTFTYHSIFNAVDGIPGVVPLSTATIVNNANGVFPAGGAIKQYVEYALVATTGSVYLTFPNTANERIDPTLYHGRYTVFARGHQTSGVSGDVELYLAANGVTGLRSPAYVNTTNTYSGLTYLGEIAIYPSGQVSVIAEGTGLYIDQEAATTSTSFVLQIANTASGARTYRLTDVILIPSQGMFSKIVCNDGFYQDTIVDNTGYLTHGKTDDAARIYFPGASIGLPTSSTIEIAGNLPTLTPGEDNQIHFLFESYTAVAPLIPSDANQEYQVRVNIVPRSVGVRSE